MRVAMVSIGLLMALFARAANQATDSSINFIDAVKLPPDKQSGMTKVVVTTLAASAVRTAADAERIALDFVQKSTGVDAREGWVATSLFYLGRDVPSFAAKRDLVWEVRFNRLGDGIVQVLWVSSTTKAVKVIFGP